MDASGGHPPVEAAVLHGRADDDLAARPRHDVDPLADDDPLARLLPRAGAQPHDLALHRPDRRVRRRRQGREPRRRRRAATARGTRSPTASSSTPRTRPRRPSRTSPTVPLSDPDAGPLAGGPQSNEDAARVDLGLSGRNERRRSRRCSIPARAAGMHPGQPLGIEAELAVEPVDAAQLRGLVAVEPHVQGATAADSRPPLAALLLELAPRSPASASAESRAAASSASSPQLASPTGAIIPAATSEARSAAPASTTITVEPARAASRRRTGRSGRPRRPPGQPLDPRSLLFLAGHAWSRLLSGCRGAGSSIPAPALPGSGSDGRRRQPPSQPVASGSR